MNATTAPESAALLDAANPLLDFTDLPLFDAIRPEQVEPAIDQLLHREKFLQKIRSQMRWKLVRGDAIWMIAAEKQEVAYDILSDIIYHSKFEKEEVEKEKGAIVEELRMYKDNPTMAVDMPNE